MPTYCVALDIEHLSGIGDSGAEVITLSSTIVNAAIDQAEGEIELWLDELNVTGSGSDAGLKTATVNLTIACLCPRLRLTNVKPSTLTLGGDTASDNMDALAASLRAMARKQVELYSRRSLGDPWAESSADAEATIVRQDHGMGQYQLDQSTVREYHDRADEYGTQDDEVT